MDTSYYIERPIYQAALDKIETLEAERERYQISPMSSLELRQRDQITALEVEVRRLKDDMRASYEGEARAHVKAIMLGAGNGRLRAALQEIKDRPVQVCADFEICQHVGCHASYTAFAIADAALNTVSSVTS